MTDLRVDWTQNLFKLRCISVAQSRSCTAVQSHRGTDTWYKSDSNIS